jgi:hypothetical protein
MLKPMQSSPGLGVATALERVAGDTVSRLRAQERGATSPDALACYWDELFNAVCARLEHLVEDSAGATLRSGVLECVGALAQLNISSSDERARHRRQTHDVVALKPPRNAF